MDNQTIQVGEFAITTKLSVDSFSKDDSMVINTINAYSWVMANSNSDFRSALTTSDQL